MVQHGSLWRKAVLLAATRLLDCASVVLRFKSSVALAVMIAVSTVLSFIVLQAQAHAGRTCCGPFFAALFQVSALCELCPSPFRTASARPASYQAETGVELVGRSSLGSSFFADVPLTSATLDLQHSSVEDGGRPVKLKVVRKLTMAQVPEALTSALVNGWILIQQFMELRWWVAIMYTPESQYDEGEGEFDQRFASSPNRIIRRTCLGSTLYYRRTGFSFDRSKKTQDVFQPHKAMVNGWDNEGDRLNRHFELYLFYPQAKAATETGRLESLEEACKYLCLERVESADLRRCAREFSRHWAASTAGTPVTFAIEDETKLWTQSEKRVLDTFLLPFLTLSVAVTTLAVGLGDIIVFMWIQTDFVQENKELVSCFYLLEVCSWWPLAFAIFSDYSFSQAVFFACAGFVPNVVLVLVGLVTAERRRKAKRCWGKAVHLVGQVLLALSVGPLLIAANVLFFDSSLTFQLLNTWYHIVRMVHVGVFTLWLYPAFYREPACGLSLVASGLLAVIVWWAVPRARRMREERMTSQFDERAHSELQAQLVGAPGVTELMREAQLALRDSESFVADSLFEKILNVVGDTFEALLLASSADSPRVRSAVLGVAIHPLAEASPELLAQLLPLIMPQLLLAIRWRTIDDGKDELCPLTSFILRKSLESGDPQFISMVYWQLFALAADQRDSASLTYRAVRLRLLMALKEHEFDGQPFDGHFCQEVLPFLSNQRRLYFQLRVIARIAAKMRGPKSQKTTMLRSALQQASACKWWAGQACFGISRPRSASVLPAPSARRRCWSGRFPWPGSKSRWRDRKVDVVREEMELDTVLEAYEDPRVSLAEPLGTPLPVEPGLGVLAVDSDRSFVAHSAVAPAVICCQMVANVEDEGEEEELPRDRRRLFALKTGDDLRQDALVLQIFQLIETAWAEHGLKDLALRPYKVLAVSPKEGIVAFVSRAVKVSTILLEHEGDVTKFLARSCRDAREGLDRLCGSAAAYSVATYLLGVGDRHLDNLMMTEDGHFFHIDFGFVLGDDPKPGSPPVRVPREVMDAIRASGRHERFCHLVGEGFALLRRTARLWTALLSLAASAGGNGVNVLRVNPDRGIHMVKQRLRLDLDEAAAKAEIVGEIEECSVSLLPLIYDKLHQAGLFWN